MKSGQRNFLQVLGAATVGLIAVPFVSDLQPEMCDCGSGLDPRISGRCGECASADEVNAWLFLLGLRPCEHSHHSSDEEFQQCKQS